MRRVVQEGHLERLKNLVELGADVNYRSADGQTLVQLAREHGHTQVEQFFLDKMNPVQVALYHVESFLGDQLSRAKQFASDLLN